jgi:hypothetical protein
MSQVEGRPDAAGRGGPATLLSVGEGWAAQLAGMEERANAALYHCGEAVPVVQANATALLNSLKGEPASSVLMSHPSKVRTMHAAHWSAYTVHCTLLCTTVQALYAAHCSVYVHCTLLCGHCALCTVHCALCTVHCDFILRLLRCAVMLRCGVMRCDAVWCDAV